MIVVEADVTTEWDKLAGVVDAIPDPMIVRTAELWLNGRSGATAAGLHDMSVWDSISRNVGALLSYFDAYLGRDRLPLIQYWETFPQPRDPIEVLCPDFLEPSAVDHRLYERIKTDVTAQIDRDVLLAVPAGDVADVLGELHAFDYQWKPFVDLDLPEPQLTMARYVIGGLVFGAYAQASGADHLVQAKRSRLLLALSAPTPQLCQVRFAREQELFELFRKNTAGLPNVTVTETTGTPSVLPFLLRQPSLATSTHEVLDRARSLRDSGEGAHYREWQRRLRRAWSVGTNDDRAERDVQAVAERLEQRLQLEGTRPPMMHVTVEVPVGLAKVSAERDIATPRWLSRWFVEHVQLRKHRRLLYRLALNEAAYRDLTLHLHETWMRS